MAAATNSPLPWKIVGDGPLKETLSGAIRARSLTNVSLMGYKPREELIPEIMKSMFVVLPSEWYENQPYAVLEAFALGKPVLAARIGGIPELVRDGETGLTFEPGNARDLADKAALLAASPERVSEMGRKARRLVETGFSPDGHYRNLMEVYGLAMKGIA
jgi:glycosyltransferase involved in cell wall biosynthesis